jgi:hypothetical protein
MYGSSYMFRHYIAIFRERSSCRRRGGALGSRLNIADGCVVSNDVVRAHHVTRHNTPKTHKTLGTLPEDGNVMPKHVGATINY